MRGAEWIIFAFAALGETRKPATRPQCADPVAASGENFVRIALMDNIPDQTVVGRVEHIMDGGGQLHNAKSGPQMSTCYRNGGNSFSAKLVGQLAKLRNLKSA